MRFNLKSDGWRRPKNGIFLVGLLVQWWGEKKRKKKVYYCVSLSHDNENWLLLLFSHPSISIPYLFIHRCHIAIYMIVIVAVWSHCFNSCLLQSNCRENLQYTQLVEKGENRMINYQWFNYLFIFRSWNMRIFCAFSLMKRKSFSSSSSSFFHFASSSNFDKC